MKIVRVKGIYLGTVAELCEDLREVFNYAESKPGNDNSKI